jgi:hypothetical protein
MHKKEGMEEEKNKARIVIPGSGRGRESFPETILAPFSGSFNAKNCST